VLGDKDVEGIVGELRSSFDTWIIVGLQGTRALPADVLATRVRDLGANVEAVAADVVAGCLAAQALAQAGDRIVVFGSFLTVGPALGWLYTSRPWSA
jgi:dihydrofolate synthase/folylpolyglutamate synthase